jgi:hypothetical protein
VPKLKSILALTTLLVVLAAGAPAAASAQIPQPVLGAWKIGSGADGFTLKKSGSKVLLTNFHLTVTCEGETTKAVMLGSYGLKVFTRGGYSTWGVGKNVGGEAEPTGVKVKAGGKTYKGEFSAIWNYEDPAHSLLGASLSFNGCTEYVLGAGPK